MPRFSNKFKKPFFGPIFPILGAKNFSKNSALSHTTLHGPLTPCQVSEKIMSQSQENFWREGQKDRMGGWMNPNS